MATVAQQEEQLGTVLGRPSKGKKHRKSRGKRSERELKAQIRCKQEGIRRTYRSVLELMRAKCEKLPELLELNDEQLLAKYKPKWGGNERQALIAIVTDLSYRSKLEKDLKAKKREFLASGELAR